jgi:signal transduction histidine kinase
LQEIVDAAIAITAADMGNIQLLDRETGTLRIVADRGFERPFLDFFEVVHDGEGSCGTALQAVERVVIDDVTTSPVFAGKPALDVLRAAGARAVQSTPLINRAGHPVGMLSTHYRVPRRPAERDLHVLDLLARQAADWIERIQTEADLKSSEERIRRLVSLLPAAVYTCDAEGRLTLYNRRAAALWGREPQLGETGQRFCGSIRLWTPAGAPLAHEDAPMALALRKGLSFRGAETVIEQPGGRRVIVNANIDPMFGPQGQTIGAINVFEDMTERKQAQSEREKLLEKLEAARAEAEAANRAKDEFLAMLGHELRNPLTPILATLQSLRLERRRPLRNEQDLIERHARLLADMVDDLLDVSRIARGKLKLLRRRTELSRVVSRSLEATRSVVEGQRHRLRVDVPEGLAVNADEDRLVQAVSNLLTNAAKYTEPSGLIQVTGGREGRFAVLRIRDNGIGVSNALLPHIFERFAQGPRTIDRGQGGLGLGLSIARHLVLLHGGTVSAASEGPGKGSEFTIRLPLGRATGTRTNGDPSAKPVRPSAAIPNSILIVDDNRDITDVLARVLRARGHAVEVAYDGSSALNVVKRFRPRFALLDIGLPRMDGYEVARRLKRQLGKGAPTLLALTGYGQLSDRKLALSAGFSEHLVKPIDLEQLLAIIEH